MQNYVMLTKKYLLFYAHIISRVETIITIFIYKFIVTPQVFSRVYLTLMNRSTALTLVKRRSTWAMTSKTSPTIPNDTPWSTHGQSLVKTLVKPLEYPIALQCQPELLPRSPNST
jgi:hypothetical protein